MVEAASIWQRVKVDTGLADLLTNCAVCGGILELGSLINIYVDKEPRFGVHRYYYLKGFRCCSIFIGAYISNYFYFQGYSKGEDINRTAYKQLSAIFGLGYRQLHRLKAEFEHGVTNGTSSY